MTNIAAQDAATAAKKAQDSELVALKRQMDKLKNELTPGPDKRQKLRSACQNFEAVFISKLWEQMRATGPKSGMFNSQQEEMYRSMFDREFTEKMAGTGHRPWRHVVLAASDKLTGGGKSTGVTGERMLNGSLVKAPWTSAARTERSPNPRPSPCPPRRTVWSPRAPPHGKPWALRSRPWLPPRRPSPRPPGRLALRTGVRFRCLPPRSPRPTWQMWRRWPGALRPITTAGRWRPRAPNCAPALWRFQRRDAFACRKFAIIGRPDMAVARQVSKG